MGPDHLRGEPETLFEACTHEGPLEAKGEAFAAEGHSKLAETGVAETGPEFEQNNHPPLVELEACYHLEFCYPHQHSNMTATQVE